MACLILGEGREKSLLRHHPWIFASAVSALRGQATLGDTVDVEDAHGQWLGRAAYSPQSQIVARLWTFDPADRITPEFFARRLAQAAQRRLDAGLPIITNAYRLVHAESDGLPGLIVDKYADWLVVQCLSAGAERWRETLVAALREQWPQCAIYERSDVDVRRKEGLPERAGPLWGHSPPPWVDIHEGPMRLQVNMVTGHKTGYYLDQRDSRLALGAWCANRDVLNAFAYTGGFGVAALQGGAHSLTQVDTSAEALTQAERHLRLNDLDLSRATQEQGDVFTLLRRYRDSRRQFDAIILDPPKFMDNRAQQDKATRGYKDINLLAFKLLRPGGVLFTFSCSGLLEPALFQKIVADAALDAGRTARVVRRLHQSADHPVALHFPEGDYLKGLLIQVD